MHRFFTPPPRPGGLVPFDEQQAHQMRRVLRLRPGDRVVALDGMGRQYEVALEEVSDGRAIGRVVAEAAAGGEPGARLTLYQSVLKRDKFEWVLQKGTEVGVAAFVPVITRRSLVRDVEDVGPEKLERWRRIIREAAEQSGRGVLPAIGAAVTLAEVLAGLPSASGPGSRALMAWEGETSRTLRQALGETNGVTGIALFIGPEGGYEAAEVEAAAAHGVAAFTLGRRVLRTETAAVVGAALVLYELGEMGVR